MYGRMNKGLAIRPRAVKVEDGKIFGMYYSEVVIDTWQGEEKPFRDGSARQQTATREQWLEIAEGHHDYKWAYAEAYPEREAQRLREFHERADRAFRGLDTEPAQVRPKAKEKVTTEPEPEPYVHKNEAIKHNPFATLSNLIKR